MAAPMREHGGVPNFAHPFLTTYKSRAPMGNSFRLDEGFSEETRSQPESDTRADSRMDDGGALEQLEGILPEWVNAMTEGERSDFAYLLLRSLRTSSIAGIVDRLYPLLHLDPIAYLPPEITTEIFTYLDPESLLRASALSRTWRMRALDARLWRDLFSSEGWATNVPEVKKFLDRQRQIADHRSSRRSGKGKARARSLEDMTDAECKSPRKRIRDHGSAADADIEMTSSFDSSLDDWAEQHGTVEADEDIQGDSTPTLRAEQLSQVPIGRVDPEIPGPLEVNAAQQQQQQATPSTARSRFDTASPTSNPLLILPPNGSIPSINWQYLYKQKRRLEDNWIAGRYINFQLPHPQFPMEAHAECVYTIQYTAKHLVSGSRDKTLRIWDLDTQRLLCSPLRGHEASVLCLQFDDRPDQDIIVSGGSDCHVIMWKFSTGEMIKKIERAHAESVLNLRFDNRFLVTCSKDKTIKVWNRRPLLPTDDAYPSVGQSVSTRFPAYIINIDQQMENITKIKPLKEFSLLMTLPGHTAAVNAIQIFENQIVSASGDRNVKIWDVKTGVCLKTMPGHLKGIACVQFDGRRIVSGSSDETVRIFDRFSGAEVACLRGHTNLVRTVQARFGDVPGSVLDDETEALAIYREWETARQSGALRRRDLTREELRARNAGSRDPNDIFAVGAKLPPGGGGSRWARIVSGSYDETVIIWKRAADGRWQPAHQLFQWQAVLNAGGQPRAIPGPPLHSRQHNLAAQQGNAVNNATAQQAQQQPQAAQAHAALLVQQAQLQLANAHITIAQLHNVSNQQAGGSQTATIATEAAPSTAGATHGSTQASSNTGEGSASTQTTQMSALVAAQQQNVLQHMIHNTSQALPHHPNHQQQQQAQQQQQPPQQQAQQSNQPNGQLLAPPTGNANPQQQQQGQGQAGQPQQQPPNNIGPGTNSRVFKLQFDSRRIICCSQDPTIVGWDFANGDEDIVQASRFFGEDW